MSYCKIKGEVLDLYIQDSNNPECYKNVHIKVRDGESFIISKGTIKNNFLNNCNSNYIANFQSDSDLPKIGDNVNYVMGNDNSSIYYGDKIITSLTNNNDNLNNCIKPYYVDYYEFYDKCNLEGKIKEIHRKHKEATLDTSLKIDVGDGDYVVKTLEGFYYGKYGYSVFGIELKFPKLLEGGGVRFFKRNDQVKFVVNSDTGEILKEGNDEKLESCNVSNQKLGDFKFEGGLTPMEVVDLNMKLRRKDVLGIEESISQETTQENNEFIVGYKNITNIGGGLNISFFILLLFFIAILKNSIKRFRLIQF